MLIIIFMISGNLGIESLTIQVKVFFSFYIIIPINHQQSIEITDIKLMGRLLYTQSFYITLFFEWDKNRIYSEVLVNIFIQYFVCIFTFYLLLFLFSIHRNIVSFFCVVKGYCLM